jgi:ERCC4-related helicase
LVALPTGLGKTFIAAVVMLNFYHWFPNTKLIFVAPTKPLVNQQIEACFQISGFPPDEIVEMNGQLNVSSRKKLWKTKRIIFATPQIIQNDLTNQVISPEDISLLVIDEAHKATGNYAYTQCVKYMSENSQGNFRILALSATPGNNLDTTQEIVNNLLISAIEIRTETSEDIKTHTFDRSKEPIIVELGDKITKIKTEFIKVFNIYISKSKIIWEKNPDNITPFLILNARKKYTASMAGKNHSYENAIIQSSLIITLSGIKGTVLPLLLNL